MFFVKIKYTKLRKDVREFVAQLVSLSRKKNEKLALPPANYRQ